jgi:pimeloyl-ACP methyl ester carboxylesterase
MFGRGAEVDLPTSEAGRTWVGQLGGGARISPDISGQGAEVDLPTWERELEARTACPTHRARIEGDGGFRRGALDEPIPAGLRGSIDPAAIAVPVLIVHGEADPVAPVHGARELAAALPHAELATVRDGRHDALNDIAHRSVAAHVVQWLERLRADPAAGPILTVS